MSDEYGFSSANDEETDAGPDISRPLVELGVEKKRTSHLRAVGSEPSLPKQTSDGRQPDPAALRSEEDERLFEEAEKWLGQASKKIEDDRDGLIRWASLIIPDLLDRCRRSV